jgi:pyrimidine-nucleoside phosphorylase
MAEYEFLYGSLLLSSFGPVAESPMSMIQILTVKRDKGKHTPEELQYIAKGAADASIPDYQLSSWLMACFLNGLDTDETTALTLAMADSGERLDLSDLPKPWIDKHSTGGVGDKTTLILLPLLAACGLTVVKMSGRGLGITGGTVDKLSSIPGFRLDLSPAEMIEQAGTIGLALTGQTPVLAPADRILYALRDATGTVNSNPLIVSSILSKKIAGGADTVVLDVKCGSGAFSKTLDDAVHLAHDIEEVAQAAGMKLSASVTDMSQPLGRTVGNALEVAEAIATLQGNGPNRLVDLVVFLAGQALIEVGKAETRESAEATAREALENGNALKKARIWFAAQGAEINPAEDSTCLPQALVKHVVEHTGPAGWLSRCSADTVGQVVIGLGGGRAKKTDEIDPSVGVEVHAAIGDRLEKGAPLFTVHAKTESHASQAARTLSQSVTVSEDQISAVPVVLRASLD